MQKLKFPAMAFKQSKCSTNLCFSLKETAWLHTASINLIPVQTRSAASMAEGLKPAAGLLLALNFCMYAVVAAIGGWAIDIAIDRGFTIVPSASGLAFPAQFSPIFFPMGNGATGFFVIFALIASVVGAAAALAGVNHIRAWNSDSLPAAASSAIIAWGLTLLAMGLACKEIDLDGRNARLRTMEAFMIILSATQLLYIIAIHSAASIRSRF